jgi:hypothetical protein
LASIPSHPSTDERSKQLEELPKVTGFIALREVLQAMERSIAVSDFEKPAEKCARDSDDRS